MQHHTKNKGDLGVLKVKLDLVEKGFTVGSLETEHAPFDIIAYRDRTFRRVQVKYRAAKDGKLMINFRNCWADKNGTHMQPVDKLEIDTYAIYCPDTDTCYYFDPLQFNKTITIRLTPSKNNQQVSINKAEDYLDVPTRTC